MKKDLTISTNFDATFTIYHYCLDAKTSDTAWSARCRVNHHKGGQGRPFWGQGHYPEKAPNFTCFVGPSNCSLKHKTQRLKVITQNTMQQKTATTCNSPSAVKIRYSPFSHDFPIIQLPLRPPQGHCGQGGEISQDQGKHRLFFFFSGPHIDRGREDDWG